MSLAKDIIDEISHRLPDRVNIYPALNRAVRLVAKRLKYHDSSRVKGELSVAISADSSSGSFPDDFWGLAGELYLSGETNTLQPLPDFRTKLLHTENTTPQYYEVFDTTLNLYPGSSSGATVCGNYWKRPAKISKPGDTMPFSELFDDTIQEALIHVYMTGGSSQDPNYIGTMETFISKSVDEIIPGMERKAPTRIPQAIDFNQMGWD